MHLQSPINLLSIFLLIGGFNGILFAVLLLKLNKQNIFINKYFSLFLIIISLQLLDRFLLETNLVYKFPTMFGLVRILEPLLAPSLYLYIRNITQPNKEYKKTYFHYSSSLLGMVMLSPIFILSIEDKLAITESNFIYWPGILEYTFPIYMIIISIQFSVYIFLSFKLLMKHTKNIRDFFRIKQILH